MSTVIICLDASEHSKNAFEFYLKNLHQDHHRLIAVHCLEDWRHVGVMEGPSPATLVKLQKEADAKTHSIKEDADRVMAERQVTGRFQKLTGKEPWEQIIQIADREGASLIVIGTRGHSAVRRTFLGSCSSSVLHHAHCPVLVCPRQHGHH